MRVGIGYDVHKLVSGRKLIIGGVEIPHDKGLLGHSDADVLIHAIMDALLGAAALKDIGSHFPDNQTEFKDISSMFLLEKTYLLLKNEGCTIVNIDSIIIAQKPKLSPYIDEMRQNIAHVLNISKMDINIKATTEEGLGFTGNMDGISSQAICLIEKF